MSGMNPPDESELPIRQFLTEVAEQTAPNIDWERLQELLKDPVKNLQETARLIGNVKD
jgi:ActR/RegA family two-component response regulator